MSRNQPGGYYNSPHKRGHTPKLAANELEVGGEKEKVKGESNTTVKSKV